MIATIRDGGDLYLLYSREQAVGLAVVYKATHPKHTTQIYPHVYWFANATARQKLECALQFLIEQKKGVLGIIIAEPQYWRFFHHLGKYGVLRRVGTFRGYFADGSDGAIFETVNA